MNAGSGELCRGLPTDLFYADPPGIPAAKAICRTCPVSPDCFAWSLDIGDEHGVLGGVAAFTRNRILASRNQPITRREA